MRVKSRAHFWLTGPISLFLHACMDIVNKTVCLSFLWPHASATYMTYSANVDAP
ncbi:hypothetical protein M405DRAFT_868457 [Rhizopogon salebrosus TDB-379]|nr:hypothetical protein M405DRAFT_868457 [Rhizopogon salebrosus TDB-379]